MSSQFRTNKCMMCSRYYSLARYAEDSYIPQDVGRFACDVYPKAIPQPIFDGDQNCPKYMETERKSLYDILDEKIKEKE